MGSVQKVNSLTVSSGSSNTKLINDKVLAGVPQLLDDFHKLIDDQETGNQVLDKLI